MWISLNTKSPDKRLTSICGMICLLSMMLHSRTHREFNSGTQHSNKNDILFYFLWELLFRALELSNMERMIYYRIIHWDKWVHLFLVNCVNRKVARQTAQFSCQALSNFFVYTLLTQPVRVLGQVISVLSPTRRVLRNFPKLTHTHQI